MPGVRALVTQRYRLGWSLVGRAGSGPRPRHRHAPRPVAVGQLLRASAHSRACWIRSSLLFLPISPFFRPRGRRRRRRARPSLSLFVRAPTVPHDSALRGRSAAVRSRDIALSLLTSLLSLFLCFFFHLLIPSVVTFCVPARAAFWVAAVLLVQRRYTRSAATSASSFRRLRSTLSPAFLALFFALLEWLVFAAIRVERVPAPLPVVCHTSPPPRTSLAISSPV